MTVNEAIKALKEWAGSSTGGYAPYCASYLEAIPRVIDISENYDTSAIEGLKIQLLYALNNAGGWRGDTARIAKETLRKWIKQS